MAFVPGASVRTYTDEQLDQMMKDDLACTSVADGGLGTLDPNSGTCQAVFNQVILDPEVLRMLLLSLAMIFMMLLRPAGLFGKQA